MNRIACVLMLAMAAARPLLAQTQGRVITDQSVVWTPGFVTVADVVKAGTELTITARVGNWYEVILPAPAGSTIRRGLISIEAVQLVEGTPEPPDRPAFFGTPPTTRAPPAPLPAIGIWAFGQLGYDFFDADRSFDAVAGHRGGVFYGGGAELRFRIGVFVGASVQHFSTTGQRVFVTGGQLFDLGIPDTIRLTPIETTLGWRFNRRTASPYVAGGIGTYLFKETSGFADTNENVNTRLTSYHVVGGIEFRDRRWLATAFEVQYTHVPSALGIGGVSAAFDEHDLGGVTAQVKILTGR